MMSCLRLLGGLRVVLLLGCLLVSVTGWANTTYDERIRHAKAVFINKISKFISWEASRDIEVTLKSYVCFYSEDFLGEAVTFIADKPNRNAIKVQTVGNQDPLHECRILLIGPGLQPQFSEQMPEHLQEGILTVADLTEERQIGEVRAGVVIGLVRKGSKMGFEVNLAEAQRLNLHISSELLKLARIVGHETVSGDGL